MMVHEVISGAYAIAVSRPSTTSSSRRLQQFLTSFSLGRTGANLTDLEGDRFENPKGAKPVGFSQGDYPPYHAVTYRAHEEDRSLPA